MESLEAEQNELQEQVSAPDFYQQDKELTAKTLERLEKVGNELEQCFARWEELESGEDG
jgi:ATP-binding cassette subfamily F protein uup